MPPGHSGIPPQTDGAGIYPEIGRMEPQAKGLAATSSVCRGLVFLELTLLKPCLLSDSVSPQNCHDSVVTSMPVSNKLSSQTDLLTARPLQQPTG